MAPSGARYPRTGHHRVEHRPRKQMTPRRRPRRHLARRSVPCCWPSLLCLALYWRGFTAWFRADDFAWLGTGIYIQNFHDLLIALFAPQAQGTIRPLSERAFFMAGFSLFGLDALPFKIVVFATQFANLALVASIGARLTGPRAAGFGAAIFWVLNGSAIEPAGLDLRLQPGAVRLLPAAGVPLSAALHGDRRAPLQRVPVGGLPVVGFGALELNVVYPAIAAAYMPAGGAPRDFRRTLPMFAVSVAYVVLHIAVAPVQQIGRLRHALHRRHVPHARQVLDLVGRPHLPLHSLRLPKWMLPAGIAVVSARTAWIRRRGSCAQARGCRSFAWRGIVIVLAPRAAVARPLRPSITSFCR